MTPITQGIAISDVVLPAVGFTPAELDDAMYQLTADPDQEALLLESCDLADADAILNPGIDLVTEAVSAVKNRLDKTMSALVRVLKRYGNDVAPMDFPSIGPDRKNSLFAYKTVTFTFDDGQTVSILFHSPGSNPMKLHAGDTLIAYRWLLNRRDITAIVSPEKGRDINLQTMAKRIMQVVEKNSEKFKANNAKRQEQQEKLAELEAEQQEATQQVDTLTQQNADLTQQISTADDRIARLRERLASMGEDEREGSGAGTGSTGAPRFDHYDDALAWVARRASELGISEAEFRQRDEYQRIKNHLADLYDQKMGGGDQSGDDLSRQLRELEDSKEAKYGSRGAGPAAAIMEWASAGGGASARPGWLHGPNRSSSAWYAAGSNANMNRAINRAQEIAEEKGLPIAVLKLQDSAGIPKGYVLAEMPASQDATAAEQARRIFSDIVPTQSMRETARDGGVSVSVETAVEAPEGINTPTLTADSVADALMTVLRGDSDFRKAAIDRGARYSEDDYEDKAEELAEQFYTMRGRENMPEGAADMPRSEITRVRQGFIAKATPLLVSIMRGNEDGELSDALTPEIRARVDELLKPVDEFMDGVRAARASDPSGRAAGEYIAQNEGAAKASEGALDQYLSTLEGDAHAAAVSYFQDRARGNGFTDREISAAEDYRASQRRASARVDDYLARIEAAQTPKEVGAIGVEVERDSDLSIEDDRQISDAIRQRRIAIEQAAREAEVPTGDDGIPEGFKEVARYFNSDNEEVTAYAQFAEGDRVMMGGTTPGEVVGHVGSGPIIREHLVRLDSGVEMRAHHTDLEAHDGQPEGDEGDNIDNLEALDTRLYRDILGSIGMIRAIDNGEERGMNRSLFTSSIANKLKTQARNGNEDVVDAALLLLAEQGLAHGRPILARRNGIWKATGSDMDYYTEIAERRAQADDTAGQEATGDDAGTSEQQQIEDGLQALIDGETDATRFDEALDEWAERAEAAGLMDTLDGKLNEAADKLTDLLNAEAANVA